MLEALRHREQEIFQYLAILGPALGGFIWLCYKKEAASAFVPGTIGVLLALLLGAIYSLALGYNFRYIVFELAKLEIILGMKDAMLLAWPRSVEAFRKSAFLHHRWMPIPWVTPPEIIKIFWISFLVFILGVTAAAQRFKPIGISEEHTKLIIYVGGVSFLAGILTPILFGWKFLDKCKKERGW
ncbi:MAG TPA: hypothetical protein P5079_00015 [Elusimicrobiota bacterium]|nr:hypothetical protein [Elusimicrobiota bacterium]